MQRFSQEEYEKALEWFNNLDDRASYEDTGRAFEAGKQHKNIIHYLLYNVACPF